MRPRPILFVVPTAVPLEDAGDPADLSVDVLDVTTYDERSGLLNPFTPDDRDASRQHPAHARGCRAAGAPPVLAKAGQSSGAPMPVPQPVVSILMGSDSDWPVMEAAASMGAGLDWKTSLQELSAEHSLGVPEYVIEDEGPDHEKGQEERHPVGDIADTE